MLKERIIEQWNTTSKNHAAEITELTEAGYPAWAVKIKDQYGVAIPLPEGVEVSESFSGASLFNNTLLFDDVSEKNLLLLVTELDYIQEPFAALCAEFINPGKDGSLREEICSDPILWWSQWKTLLGNKNVDDTVYDVLGELYVLKYLVSKGIHAIWTGPDRKTYDIDCGDLYYEVKSTLAREKREITLNNHFQLDPPKGKQLKLVLCQFEPSQTGISINMLVDELVSEGYSRYDLDEKLKKVGLEKRKSSRNRCYYLNSMIRYNVDENFPAIRESSFIGGVLPPYVRTIQYTISLDGVEGEQLKEQQVQNDI